MFKTLSMLTLSLSLFAGAPMITDDPFTLDKNGFEINTALLYTSNQSSDIGSVIDFNYGITNTLQINLIGAYDIGNNKSDVSEIALKYNFFSSENFSMAIQPRYITAIFPNEIYHGTFLPIEIAYVMDTWSFISELAYLIDDIDRVHEESLAYGAYVAKSYEKSSFMLELHGFSSLGLRQDRLSLNVGTSYTFTETLALLLSVGSDVYADENSNTLFSYIGIQLGF